jgi:uncharacterized protein (TIGR02145 family)
MKAKVILLASFTMITFLAAGQRPTIELTFTAVDSASWTQLDSIKVMNRTQGGDTTLLWPDTVLVLDYPVGIQEAWSDQGGFELYQSYPNPAGGRSTLTLYIPKMDDIHIFISDILGRRVYSLKKSLDEGLHAFHVMTGGRNIYFVTAMWRNHRKSIKVVSTSASNSINAVSLKYMGRMGSNPNLKGSADLQYFPFLLGDELLYIGYISGLESGMLDIPQESKSYTFQFATNISCPGTPTVEYEGQVYSTIQIFSQCWLKENLNAGNMIPGNQEQLNNGVLEKYCYNNDPANCDDFGGLYQWTEMMQYTTQPGVQGICPPGWHLPTDEEWKVLEGAADSQYGMGDPTWDYIEYRGFDVGANLKSETGWIAGNGNDLYGFSGLPAGQGYGSGGFSLLGNGGYFWTSLEGNDTDAWWRYLHYTNSVVRRLFSGKEYYSFSVRCVLDQ